jgi:hypothetical protein
VAERAPTTFEIAASRTLFAGGAVTFDHGFVRRAELELRDRVIDEDVLWELLRHPSARFLSELDLRVSPMRDLGLVTALLVHGPRPPLRTLAIVVGHAQVRPPTLELDGLSAAFPQLTTLDVRADAVRLGGLELPWLRRLVVGTTRQQDVEDVLAEARALALERLELARVDAARFELALVRLAMPRLVALAIAAAPDGLRACRAIARSPIAAQLVELDLGATALPHEAVELLVAEREAFAALATLRIAPTAARSGGFARLRAAGYPIAAT